MIELYLLKYLIKFYETGNLTKASSELFISQPSLTRSMKKIEDELGIPLFNRTSNKISFNDIGIELVKYAKDVLAAHERMIEKINNYYNSLTTISIGLVAPGPLFKYGNILHSSFGNKNVSTSIKNEDKLIEDLKNGTMDIVFTNRFIDDSEINCKKCLDECLYLLVPKNHFVAGMKEGIYFNDIDGQSFLMASEIGSWNKIVEKKLCKSKFFLQNSKDLLEIINASSIPSFVTNLTMDYHSNEDRIAIPFLDEDAKMSFYIACLKKKATNYTHFFHAIKNEYVQNK